MSIQKTSVVKEVTIDLQNGALVVSDLVSFVENDEKIINQIQKRHFNPGDDLSSVPENVRQICNLVWTQEMIDVYLANNSNS